jgi:hypothetical protein
MHGILEFFVIFFLAFRWFTLPFGIGLIFILVYLWRPREKRGALKTFGIITAALIIVVSLYNIAGVDFRLFLP